MSCSSLKYAFGAKIRKGGVRDSLSIARNFTSLMSFGCPLQIGYLKLFWIVRGNCLGVRS